MNRYNSFSYTLSFIKVDQFAYFEENYIIDNKEINVGLNLQYKKSDKDKRIGTFMNFEFIQNNLPIIKAQISLHFIINENSWNKVLKKDDNIILPKVQANELASHVLGTARGILFEKLSETIFAGIILPIIDTKDIIKEDLVFSNENEDI